MVYGNKVLCRGGVLFCELIKRLVFGGVGGGLGEVFVCCVLKNVV